MALHRLLRRAGDLVDAAGQELLRRELDPRVGRVDLHHADTVDLHGHPVHRVGLAGADLELQELEREALHLLAERSDVRAASADDPVADRDTVRAGPLPAAGDDQHLVRTDLRVLVRPDDEADEERRHEDGADDDQSDDHVARTSRSGAGSATHSSRRSARSRRKPVTTR